MQGQTQQEFLTSVLSQLPGVDTNSEAIQQALRNLQQQQQQQPPKQPDSKPKEEDKK